MRAAWRLKGYQCCRFDRVAGAFFIDSLHEQGKRISKCLNLMSTMMPRGREACLTVYRVLSGPTRLHHFAREGCNMSEMVALSRNISLVIGDRKLYYSFLGECQQTRYVIV